MINGGAEIGGACLGRIPKQRQFFVGAASELFNALACKPARSAATNPSPAEGLVVRSTPRLLTGVLILAFATTSLA